MKPLIPACSLKQTFRVLGGAGRIQGSEWSADIIPQRSRTCALYSRPKPDGFSLCGGLAIVPAPVHRCEYQESMNGRVANRRQVATACDSLNSQQGVTPEVQANRLRSSPNKGNHSAQYRALVHVEGVRAAATVPLSQGAREWIHPMPENPCRRTSPQIRLCLRCQRTCAEVLRGKYCPQGSRAGRVHKTWIEPTPTPSARKTLLAR